MRRFIGIFLVIESAVLIYIFGFHLADQRGPGLGWLIAPTVIFGVSLLVLLPMLAFASLSAQLRGKSDPRFANAPIGIGTLRELTRTGWSINGIDQYKLTFDVQTERGQRFTSVAKQLVPPQAVATLTPGLILAVCYLPDNHEIVELAPASRMDEAQQVMHTIGVREGIADPEAPMIEARGVVTTGVVMALVPTGEVRAGRSAVHVTVRVQAADGSYFDAEKVLYLPAQMMGRVQVGCQVEVTYLPHDKTRFILGLT